MSANVHVQDTILNLLMIQVLDTSLKYEELLVLRTKKRMMLVSQ